MKFHEYQPLAMRTAKMFPSLEMNLIHAALGIGSEIGELAETVNGIWMDLETATHSGTGGLSNIQEEIGDAAWYAQLACAHLGWQFHELIVWDQQAIRDLSYPLFKASSTRSPVAVHECAVAFSGEILTIIKANAIYSKTLNEEKLKQNLALFITSLAYLSEIYEVKFEAALEHNIDKLRKRYPNKYSDADALARADKAAEDFNKATPT